MLFFGIPFLSDYRPLVIALKGQNIPAQGQRPGNIENIKFSPGL